MLLVYYFFSLLTSESICSSLLLAKILLLKFVPLFLRKEKEKDALTHKENVCPSDTWGYFVSILNKQCEQ